MTDFKTIPALLMGAGSDSTSTPLAFSTPERLVEDFVSRGFVVLAPENLGIPSDVHDRLYEQQKKAFGGEKEGHSGDHRYATNPNPTTLSLASGLMAACIPQVFEVLNAPGLIAACNRLVGENWAIVPFVANLPFRSGPNIQYWHKDDNRPWNGRKQRHHQAVQIEILYFPQRVDEDMGPIAIIPYSHYWTINHEENPDNFVSEKFNFNNYERSGKSDLDVDLTYHASAFSRFVDMHHPNVSTLAEPVSGPDSKYDRDDIVNRRTSHDVWIRRAVTNTGWPLVRQFEAAPPQDGSIVLLSHNTYHRGNPRRDDWETWPDKPRFMWRFWVYRTTDPVCFSSASPAEVPWNTRGPDPLTHIDLAEATEDVTAVWRYHHHWTKTGQPSPPRPALADLSSQARKKEADRLFARLHTKDDEGEPVRIGAAYQLASLGDTRLAIRLLGPALYNERERVRRAATYGLIAVGPEATETLLEATRSPVKWVRKAGVHGLGDASPLSEEVLQAVVTRLKADPSVYVRHVAAEAPGCLGRRAIATGVGVSLVPACLEGLVYSLSREANRLSVDEAQGGRIHHMRPTEECDICEGWGKDFGFDRFEPVRSAVRENVLCSLVILSSHGTEIMGPALEPTVLALKAVVREDKNVFCVGFAMDALNRLVHLPPEDEKAPPRNPRPLLRELQADLPTILSQSPVQAWESLLRGGFHSTQDNANNNEQLLLPGRLDDPQMVLKTDPRAPW